MIPNIGFVARLAFDNFNESDHPRANNGQFGSGGAKKFKVRLQSRTNGPGKFKVYEAESPEAAEKLAMKEWTGGKIFKVIRGETEEHHDAPEPKMRDYAPKELDWEYEVEYKKYSKSAFPNAFSSREDFQKKFDAAPMRPLTEKEFKGLGNSMAAGGIGKNEAWVHQNFGHRRDSKAIVAALKDGETAPPIVLKSGDRLRLMAGQTRLAAGAALGMSMPVKIIDVGPQMAHDADWDESKHPRSDDGKFGSGGGGSGTPGNGANNNKPAQVSSTLTGVFTKAGFKKTKQPGANGTVVYYHPASGAKVAVHPAPAGKKWSSKWTHEADGKTSSGEGSSLAKLLGVTVQKAEAKKAEPTNKFGLPSTHVWTPMGSNNLEKINDIQSKGWKHKASNYTGDKAVFEGAGAGVVFDYNTGDATSFANYADAVKYMDNGTASSSAPAKSLNEAQNAEFKAAETFLQGKGYKATELDGNAIIYQNGAAKVKLDSDTGDWLAVTPGHATKEGKGTPALVSLMEGKGILAGVKNSGQTIQTAAEKAAMSESSKKAAEAHAKAVAAQTKKDAIYTKLKAMAPQPNASQQNAISKYSGSGYSSWNDKLRHDHTFAKSDPLTKQLDDYLNASVFEEEVVLNRKVDGEYAKILKSIIFEGTKFIDRGYVSASTNPNSWSGSFKFMITCPKGTRGAAIGKWSQHPSEQEVLLPRGSAFVVTAWDPGANTVHVTLDQSHFEQAAMKEAA